MSGVYVYKILGATDHDAARRMRDWRGSEVDLRDGFIHFSAAEQIAGTLAAHFRSQANLVLMQFRADALGPELRWEPSRNGELFPHLYGPLDIAGALGVWRIDVDNYGNCRLPELPE